MQVVELSKVLDLIAAPALLESLIQTKGHDVRVNAEPVQRLGAQCLQILFSAKKTWEVDDCDFSLENPSPAFMEAMTLMGASLEDLTYRAHAGHRE